MALAVCDLENTIIYKKHGSIRFKFYLFFQISGLGIRSIYDGIAARMRGIFGSSGGQEEGHGRVVERLQLELESR